MRFTFLTGDTNWMDYGGKWISSKLNNGDWDYWLVLELLNWHDAIGEDESPAKYHVELSAVAPSALSAGTMAQVIRSCGWEGMPDNELAKVEICHSYGVKAVLHSADGNNARKLIQEAKAAAKIQGDFLFGFAMDRPQNRIGNDGWDFISGNIGFKG